mgnify:CR=1 FL=1
MMFGEELFEQFANSVMLPIVTNFGDFLILVMCVMISIALWLLPFVIMFSPLYFDSSKRFKYEIVIIGFFAFILGCEVMIWI